MLDPPTDLRNLWPVLQRACEPKFVAIHNTNLPNHAGRSLCWCHDLKCEDVLGLAARLDPSSSPQRRLVRDHEWVASLHLGAGPTNLVSHGANMKAGVKSRAKLSMEGFD